MARIFDWLVYSWLGRIALSTITILAALPQIIFTDRYSSNYRLLFLIAVAVACLIVTSLIVLNRIQPAKPFVLSTLLITCLIYFVSILWVVYGIRFLNYTTRSGLASEDTAIFEQSFWTTVNGRGLLYSSLEGGSHLAIHSSLILIPLALGYKFFSTTLYLFALQTGAIVSTAVLLFKIAARLVSNGAAFVFSLVYLLHPLVLAAQVTFHEVFFAPVFLLLAISALLKQNLAAYVLAIVLFLTVNERAGLTIFGLSLIILFLRRPWYWFGITVLVSVFGFATSIWILSSYRTIETLPLSYYYFGHLGNTPAELLGTVVQQPARIFAPLVNEASPKLLLLFAFVGPLFLVLPFASPWWLVALPEGAFNFLAAGLNGLSWHYAVFLIGLVLGAIATLGRIVPQTNARNRKIQTVMATAMLFNTLALLPLSLNPEALVVDRAQSQVIGQIVARIPKDAAVCADYNLTQYLSQRSILYDNQLSNLNQLATCEFSVIDRQVGKWNLPTMARVATGQGDQGDWHILIDQAGLMLIQRSVD